LDRLGGDFGLGLGFEFGGVSAPVSDLGDAPSTTGLSVSAGAGDGQGAEGTADTDMEALLREILAEPRLGENEAQVVVADEAGVEAAGEQSGLESGGDEEAMEDAKEDAGLLTTAIAEWTTEIEMQRMLDEVMSLDPLTTGMDLGDMFAMGMGGDVDLDFGTEFAALEAHGDVGVF